VAVDHEESRLRLHQRRKAVEHEDENHQLDQDGRLSVAHLGQSHAQAKAQGEDAEGEESSISLAAMEAQLKPGMVAIFDAAIARAYLFPAGEEPTWGDDTGSSPEDES
jgi:hypothetical protein